MKDTLIQLNKSLRGDQKKNKLQSGDVVRVHKKIKEGDKERIQVFKGLVLSIKGKQSSSPTVTVRRESQGIGVEITFPLYSPLITKIDILRHSKVRRSKLYYMRDRTGKAAKMKIRELNQEEVDLMNETENKKEPNGSTEKKSEGTESNKKENKKKVVQKEEAIESKKEDNKKSDGINKESDAKR